MSTTARSRTDNRGYSQYTIPTVSNWTPSTQAVSAKPIIKIKRQAPSPPVSNIVIKNEDERQARKTQFERQFAPDWFSQDPLGALDADMSLTVGGSDCKRSRNSKNTKKYTTFAIEPSFMKKLARKK